MDGLLLAPWARPQDQRKENSTPKDPREVRVLTVTLIPTLHLNAILLFKSKRIKRQEWKVE